MSNAFHHFLKVESAKSKQIPTGMILLDSAFMIPLESCILFEGAAMVGTTAIATQLATHLSLEKRLVIYFDIFSSTLSHRINEVNDDYFLIFKLWNTPPTELLEYLEIVKTYCEDAILVFDNIHFLDSIWDKQWSFSDVVKKIKLYNPKATVIATQRKKYHSNFWPITVSLNHLENIYCEMEDGTTQLAGHLAKILGPIGTSKIYIDHFTGKVSKAYEYVVTEIQSGRKTKTSTFSFNGVTARGAWNLVHQVGKKERNELSLN